MDPSLAKARLPKTKGVVNVRAGGARADEGGGAAVATSSVKGANRAAKPGAKAIVRPVVKAVARAGAREDGNAAPRGRERPNAAAAEGKPAREAKRACLRAAKLLRAGAVKAARSTRKTIFRPPLPTKWNTAATISTW